MRLEIRDVSAGDLYDIGSEGAILGRERAKTDIQLRDESISKRHARIFLDDGMWLLEDLNSSNGTFIDEQRITSPVEISKGSHFALAQRKFEVVYVEGASAMPAPPGSGIDSMQPLPGMESEAFAGSFDQGAGSDGGEEEEEESEGVSVGAVLAALPKAVAYYMINVPLLAVNPIGTIRKGAEQQPVEPMGNIELAAFAIPAGVVSALVGAIFGTLASIFTSFSIAPLIAGLIGAAIGGVVFGVIGFLTHPILKFLVKLFKGSSNKRSRTNYAVQSYTLSIIASVPNGIGVLITAIAFAVGLPILSILVPVMMLVVSLVFLFFAYRWVVAFDLVSWMRKVVLVLGVLSVLGALGNLGSLVMAQINGMGSGDTGETPTSGVVADVPEGTLSDDARKAIEEAGGEPDAVEAANEAARAALAKNREIAKNLRAGDPEDPPPDSEDPPPPAAKDDPPPPPPARTAPPPARNDPPPPPARTAPPPAARTAPPPPRRAVSAPVSTEHPLGETGFVRYLDRRKIVEAAIDDDPSLLEKRSVRKPYERLWRKTYSIRDKYYKKGKRKDRWVKDKILAREKGQEIYKATQKDLDSVYNAIFSN